MSNSEKSSIPSIVSELVDDVTSLVEGTIELAKAEIQESARAAAASTVSMLVAISLAYVGSLFLLVAGALGMIAAGMAPWLAVLIVGGTLVFLALMFVAFGVKKIKQVRGPVRTIESVNATVALVNSVIPSRK